MRTILLTGKNGQVGWELHRILASLGSVTATDRQDLDLADASAIRKTVRELRPGVIINAAAYTAVDKAEENESLATIVNGSSVGALADEAKKLDALLIHYSTDYVFDGSKPTPYTEDDAPCPVNAYGRSKLLGEERIRQSGCDYLILRTSWVYASRGHNFARTILRLAKERQELDIIDDQVGAPTWAHDIAEGTADIVRQALREREQGNFVSGIFNLTSAGETSWYGLACAVLERAKQRALLDRLPILHPVASDAYPLPALRPKNSRLATDKLFRRFGLALPYWQDSLIRCLDEL